MRDYPDINVEVSLDSGLADVVAERYDAGIRLGEQVAKDMVAVRIGPDLRMAAVGAPAYFSQRSPPRSPRTSPIIAASTCASRRWAGSTRGNSKNGRELKVRVEGQLIFNDVPMILAAARAGFGIGYVPEDQVQEDVAAGRLVRVLADWCPPFPGYHLYYPSRRQPTPAFTLLVDALRYREGRPVAVRARS